MTSVLSGADASGVSWLEQTFGDKLIGKDGAVSAKDIAAGSDMVSLYFSAHWCPPCRGFTPRLAETYKKVTGAGKKWEVIFLSSDKDQQAFDGYFKEHPWKALKYSERDLKETLSGKFRVQGIPTLIHMDPKTGAKLNMNGRNTITEDPEGANFPWKSPTFWDVMGEAKLLKHNNDKSGSTEVAASSLKEEVDYIGIYFSAHWCPPCRGFTPKLNKWYKKHKANKKFEFIFNTWDRTESDHKDYWTKEMDFLTRKYDDGKLRKALDSMYEVQGIPTLVIVDAKTGALVTKDARGSVDSDPEAEKFPWEKEPVSEMGPSCVDALNMSPCVMAYCEQEQGKAAMGSSAAPYVAMAKKAGDWPNCMEVEFIVDDGKHALSGRVSGLLKKKDTEVLFIMKLQDKVLYYLEDVTRADQITKENVERLMKGYKEGSLKKRDLVL